MASTLQPAVESASGYTIRRLRPEDAAGVTQCVCCVYGDSYLHPEVYHPDEIIRLNETGELVSVVALDRNGQVVGHYALERPGLGAIAEEGEALVRPEHRHHHLMEALRELLEAEAHRLELTGLFGQAVTNHIFTQKVWERFGLRACGLSLGATPRSFHNMSQSLPQRMSLLLGFKYLRTPSQLVFHVPDQHRTICERILDQFGTQVEFRQGRPAEAPGQLSVDYSPEQQQAVIRVQHVGAEMATEISRTRRSLCEDSGVEVIFVELPLSQAGTPELCRAVEQDGFFFSGIGPCFAPDGDALRLQFLNVEVDISLLQLHCPFARELAAYVAEARKQVGTAYSC